MPFTSPVSGGNVITDWCIYTVCVRVCVRTHVYIQSGFIDISISVHPPGTLQQLISDTVVRWAQESVIEDPELVRAMFILLHHQYDGIREVVSLHKICTFYQCSGKKKQHFFK